MTEEMNKLNLKNQISIKIFYQEECRRFSVSEKIDYNELCTIVGDTLSIEFKQDQHFLSYQDEEDELIIFSTDLELSEAFKFAQTFNRSILRLFISIDENKKHKRYEQKENEKQKRFEQKENKKQKRFEQKENEKQERIEQKEENDDSSESLSFSDEEKLMIPYLPRKLYKELQNFLLQIQDDLDKFLNNSLFIEWLKSHFLQILQEYQQIYENGEIQTKLFSNSLKKFLENIEIEPETKDKIEQLFLLIAQKMIKIKQDEQKFPFEMIFKTMSETPFPDLLTTIRESSKNKFQRKVHKRKCKHEKRKKKYQKFKSKKKDNHNFTKKKIIKKYKNKKDGKKQPQLYKHSKYNRSYKSKKKYDPNNDKFNKKKLQKYKKEYNTRRGRKFERKNPNSFKPKMKSVYSNMNKVRNDHDHNFLDTKQNLKLKNNFKQEIKEQIRIERKQWKQHKKQFRKQKMDFKKQLRKQRNKIKKENKQFPDKRKYNTKHYRKNNSKHYRKKFNKKKIPKNVIYQEELTVLENIGFINHDLNLKLLSIYNGDTKQTIQALLNKLY